MRYLLLLALTLLIFSCSSDVDSDRRARWSPEKAGRWYKEVGVIKGFNYQPRTAVNMTEMWQEETFDIKTIDQELGWAKKHGYNSVRVFIQYLLWEEDASALKGRLEEFLQVANKHGISTMFVLFCDVSFGGEPYLGKQRPPREGIHNSGWVSSPGEKYTTDVRRWPKLKAYVKDIIGTFRDDKRVLFWDLYNEAGWGGKSKDTIPLLATQFSWAREAQPSQPVTAGVWNGMDSKISQVMLAHSDIITIHIYTGPSELEKDIKSCLPFMRPILCTEWLYRQNKSDFKHVLPIFKKYKVGWYHWGFVAGKTQTYLPWSNKNDQALKVWQHDVLNADGSPYNPWEMEQVKIFDFK